MKVNCYLYFQPPTLAHLGIDWPDQGVLAQYCTSLKVTSHRKVPVAILCSVIEKTVPPQKFQIYQGPPIDWLECILNISIVQIFHRHKISQYCTAPSHQSSISLRKRLKHVTGDIAQAIHITQSPSVNIWSLKRQCIITHRFLISFLIIGYKWILWRAMIAIAH